MLRVSADEGEQDPRSEQRRLGVPALLGKIPPGRNAPGGEEQEEQDGGGVDVTVHSGNRLSITGKHL